jgi:hypothetical protein
MIKTLFIFLFVFFSAHLRSNDKVYLNYIQAHQFRLSATDNINEWIIPFYQKTEYSNPFIELLIFGSANRKVPSLIKDVDSKNKDRIQKTVDENYGNPLDASAKISLRFRIKNIRQSFSTNAGAFALVNDPIFPYINGTLFHDYTSNTSLTLKWGKKLELIPKLTIGRRRVLYKTITVTDLADKKPDTKIKNRPFRDFSEFSLHSKYDFKKASVFFHLNSLPIRSQRFQYWDSNVGLKIPNFINMSNTMLFKNVTASVSFSPFYGGSYSMRNTIKAGVGFHFSKYLTLDAFLSDQFLPGAILKLDSRIFNLTFFSFERHMNSLDVKGSRQYGFNFSAKF